jgi:hypothetical protein
LAQELAQDLNHVISVRLPAAKIFQSLETRFDYTQPHHEEAFGDLFVERVYFVQKGGLSNRARDILARTQRATSVVLQDVRLIVAKMKGQPELVVDGGPHDGGASNEPGSRPSDDTSARYATTGLSKSQIARREIDAAISILEGNLKAQEFLDWTVREYLLRIGGQIPDKPTNVSDININLNLDVKELFVGGVHLGGGGGNGGNGGGNGTGKGRAFRAFSHSVKDAIQTLAAATVLWAAVFSTSVAPAELNAEDTVVAGAENPVPIAEHDAAKWRYATVNAERGLNVREGASIEADEIGAIRNERLVEVRIDPDADFVLVRYGDENGEQRMGFVAREYLRFIP